MQAQTITIYDGGQRGQTQAQALTADLIPLPDFVGVPIFEGSKKVCKLMAEDYLTLKLILAKPLPLRAGDFAFVDAQCYEIVDVTKGDYNKESGGFEYELRLDAQYWKFKHKLCKFLPDIGAQETTWTFTAPLESHAQQILRNMNYWASKHAGYKHISEDGSLSDWSLAIEPENDKMAEEFAKAKTLQCDSTNVMDTITALAEEYECEWWFIGNTLYFGKCRFMEYDAIRIRQNLDAQVTRSDSQESKATRIYAYGSDRNLPGSYRKDLIFQVTETQTTTDKKLRITDATRPLNPRKHFYASDITGQHKPARDYKVSGTDVCSFGDTSKGDPYYIKLGSEYYVDGAASDSAKVNSITFAGDGSQEPLVGKYSVGINAAINAPLEGGGNKDYPFGIMWVDHTPEAGTYKGKPKSISLRVRVFGHLAVTTDNYEEMYKNYPDGMRGWSTIHNEDWLKGGGFDYAAGFQKEKDKDNRVAICGWQAFDVLLPKWKAANGLTDKNCTIEEVDVVTEKNVQVANKQGYRYSYTYIAKVKTSKSSSAPSGYYRFVAVAVVNGDKYSFDSYVQYLASIHHSEPIDDAEVFTWEGLELNKWRTITKEGFTFNTAKAVNGFTFQPYLTAEMAYGEEIKVLIRSGITFGNAQSVHQLYRPKNLSIYPLSDTTNPIATNVVFNPDWLDDAETYAANWFELPAGSDIKVGDKFIVKRVKECLVPWSYFTPRYSLEEESELAVNGVATTRLLLPEYVYEYEQARDEQGNLMFNEDGTPIYAKEQRVDEEGNPMVDSEGNPVYTDKDKVISQTPLKGYLDLREDMREEEAVEDVVIFEDVYPSKKSHITELGWSDVYTDEEDGGDGETIKKDWRAYRFKCDTFDYGKATAFSDDYRLEGLDMEITFTSGKLNGMTFVVKYLKSSKMFEIMRDDNTKLPNEILGPDIGDEFVFSGFNMYMVGDTDGFNYIDAAEAELLKKAKEYVEKANTDASTYSAELYCDFAQEVFTKASRYQVPLLGYAVNLYSEQFFGLNDKGNAKYRASRVLGYELPLDIPYDNPTLTIGEKGEYSRLGAIEDKLDSLGDVTGRLSAGAGGSNTTSAGASLPILTSNDLTTIPTDTNVYSALRARMEFLLRGAAETISEVWSFLRGARFGNYVSGESGAIIDASGNAEVGSLQVRQSVTADSVEADSVKVADRLDMGDSFVAGTQGGAIWMDELGNAHLQVDFAEITKKAVFSEIDIKKLNHVGGVIILSAASMECRRVEETSDGYRCYFNTTDGDKTIANQFVVNDLARCQTFNIRQGVSTDAANRYYWRKVIEVGDDYITLSKTDCDPAVINDAPAAGDSIVQMGNASDRTRQNLIIIAAYGDGSPYIYQYKGIDTYALSKDKLKTRISPEGNYFCGEFHVEVNNGADTQSLKEYIDEQAVVYRLVASNRAIKKGEVYSLLTDCQPYRIKAGVMEPLQLNGNNVSLGRLSNQLLSLGDGLFMLGNAGGADYNDWFTLTYTTKDAEGNVIETKPWGGVETEFGDAVAEITFTLRRNGQLIAETSVEGKARAKQISVNLDINDENIIASVKNDLATELGDFNKQFTELKVGLEGVTTQVQDKANYSYVDQAAESIRAEVGTEVDAIEQSRNYYIGSTEDFQQVCVRKSGMYDNAWNVYFDGFLTGITLPAEGEKYTISVDLDFEIRNTNSNRLIGSVPPTARVQFMIRDIATLDTLTTSHSAVTANGTQWHIRLADYGKLPKDMTTASVFQFSALVFLPTAYTLESLKVAKFHVNKNAWYDWQPATIEDTKLRSAGIEITKDGVTLWGDKVTIKTNTNDVPTALFDSDGNVKVQRVIAYDAAGNKVASMNEDGFGSYKMFWPDGGDNPMPRLVLSPTANPEESLIVYNEEGEPIYMLGTAGLKQFDFMYNTSFRNGWTNDISGVDTTATLEPVDLWVITYNGVEYWCTNAPSTDKSLTTSSEINNWITQYGIRGWWYCTTLNRIGAWPDGTPMYARTKIRFEMGVEKERKAIEINND